MGTFLRQHKYLHMTQEGAVNIWKIAMSHVPSSTFKVLLVTWASSLGALESAIASECFSAVLGRVGSVSCRTGHWSARACVSSCLWIRRGTAVMSPVCIEISVCAKTASHVNLSPTMCPPRPLLSELTAVWSVLFLRPATLVTCQSTPHHLLYGEARPGRPFIKQYLK